MNEISVATLPTLSRCFGNPFFRINELIFDCCAIPKLEGSGLVRVDAIDKAKFTPMFRPHQEVYPNVHELMEA